MISLAVIALFFALVGTLACVYIYYTPVQFSAALVMAFAGLVSLETVVCNSLSLFHSYNRQSLLIIHLGLLIGGLTWSGILHRSNMTRLILKLRYLVSLWCRHPAYYLLLPLLLLLFLTAWIYPPNTYDSLTYHMARVARWIANESTGYYPTPNDRQNVMGPGAEYLIAFFQLLTGSDRLANLVQFFAFVFSIVGLRHLSRLLRLPSRWIPYIVLLGALSPMAMMQASGTKNDLVASVMTLAVIIASRRLYLGNVVNMRRAEFILLGICIAAGYMVKPTSILVCIPLLVGGYVWQLVLFRDFSQLRRVLVATGLMIIVMIFVIGPDVARKANSHASRHEVYPLFSEYTIERVWNPLRGVAQNLPFPERVKGVFHELGFKGELRVNNIFNFAEDMVGNPFQVLPIFAMFVVSLCAYIFCFRRFSVINSLLLVYPLTAWFVFGLIVRDQTWLTRLQIPLFMLLPFSFVALGRLIKGSKRGRCFGVVLALWSISAASYATVAAVHVPARPIVLAHFWGERAYREKAYYNNVDLFNDHSVLLQQAEESQCKRVGLLLGPDTVEYPLAWRARSKGLETRHLWNSYQEKGERIKRQIDYLKNELDWPCIIYVAYGSREAVPNQGEQWISAGNGDYHAFSRNLKWEFAHSKEILLKMSKSDPVNVINRPHKLLVESSPKKLKLNSIGVDPYFFLPPLQEHQGNSAVLMVDIESPIQTKLQVYYKTKQNPIYDESQTTSADLLVGRNDVNIFLPMSEIIGSLRIDPGQVEGEYLINDLEIRGIDSETQKKSFNRTFPVSLQ